MIKLTFIILNFYPTLFLEEPPIPPVTQENVANVLQQCYEQKIAPFERMHAYEQFHTSTLTGPEFNSKPMVLFLGQYSVGKTTMIKYLMGGQEYPGSQVFYFSFNFDRTILASTSFMETLILFF